MPIRFGHKRSDYDIVRVEHDRVFIIDLDLGNKSVTNDAENVYIELQSFWPGRRLVYRDSLGQWSEITDHIDHYEDNCNIVAAGYYSTIHFILYSEHIPNI